MKLEYIVKNNKYQNINQVLKNEFDLSSRLTSKLIKNKKILLNGIFVDTRTIIKENNLLEIFLDDEEDNSNIIPSKMNLNIIFEDEGMLVVNKPSGTTIHPSILHYEDSLSNGIRYYFDQIGLKKKIRPVNRLDKDTSGLVIFAKNAYIQECLIKQMKNNIFKKEYLCIVTGKLSNKKGIINAPIARKQGSIIERCVNANGQNSITHYEVIKELDNYSLVKCELETGRTHQIRVHFAYINHPLIGDYLYGTKSDLISRQALHCYRLSFVNPISHSFQSLESPLPNDMKLLA